MTLKQKMDIMKKLNFKNQQQIKMFLKDLEYIQTGIELSKKLYLGSYEGSGKNTHFIYNTTMNFCKDILKIKESGNDAPRNGQHGKYIIFSNNKNNIEIIKFLFEFVEVLKEK